MVLGAWLNQKEYGFSTEETVMQIQKNPSFVEITLFVNGYLSLILFLNKLFHVFLLNKLVFN